MKVMVRSHELPCRNSWANDLFTPKASGDQVDDIVIQGLPVPRVAPLLESEGVSLVSSSQNDRGTGDGQLRPRMVDVVVDEVPSSVNVPERTSLLMHDPRSAILKARERYRARLAAEARQADAPPLAAAIERLEAESSYRPAGLSSWPAPSPSAELESFPRPPRPGDVPPVQKSEVSRAFPNITSFPDDEARFSSVPEPVIGIPLPRPQTQPLQPPRRVAQSEARPADHRSEPEWELSLSATTQDQDVDLPTSAQEAEALVSEDVPTTWESDEIAAREVDAAISERMRQHRHAKIRWGRRRRDYPRPVREEPVYADFQDEQYGDSGEALEAAAVLVEPPPADVEVVPPVVPAAREDLSDIVPIIEIAPDVPRMCSTCRDFRPADSGDRGWCTNNWAFSHRRMVGGDELPCETTLGCWWLPHDNVWMDTGDLSAHSHPTPLVDHWLAHKVNSATDDGVETRRRRRS